MTRSSIRQWPRKKPYRLLETQNDSCCRKRATGRTKYVCNRCSGARRCRSERKGPGTGTSDLGMTRQCADTGIGGYLWCPCALSHSWGTRRIPLIRHSVSPSLDTWLDFHTRNKTSPLEDKRISIEYPILSLYRQLLRKLAQTFEQITNRNSKVFIQRKHFLTYLEVFWMFKYIKDGNETNDNKFYMIEDINLWIIELRRTNRFTCNRAES